MRKKGLCLLLSVLTLLTATGCGSAFEDEYYYEEAFSGDIGTLSGDATELQNFSMLKTAITGMISRGEERADFRLNNYNGNPNEDLAAACYEIKSGNPLGAYAVETLSYETNYVVSYYIATIYITYKRSAEEIAAVRYAGTLAALDDCVLEAVDGYVPETVVRVYSSAVNEDYIRALVKQHYYEDPVSLVKAPQVRVDCYPVEGANRIYDLQLDFGLPDSLMIPMRRETERELRSSVAKVTAQAADPAHLLLAATEFLSASCGAGPGTDVYADTVYGTLVRRDGNALGLALTCRAMCSALGVECIVVEGSTAMGGEAHYWNIVCLDGAYYHVDVSAFAEDAAGAFLLPDDALWGTYIWNTEDYPACVGTLRYADLVPQEETADADGQGETESVPAEETPEEQPEETVPDPETEGEEIEEKSEIMP